MVREPRSLESRHQLAGERRALVLLFVLEVDEDLRTPSRVRHDRVAPVNDVVVAVPLVAKPEVRVRGGDLDRRRQPLAVGYIQRHPAGRKPLEDLGRVPRHVTKFERGSCPWRQRGQELVEDVQIPLEGRR